MATASIVDPVMEEKAHSDAWLSLRQGIIWGTTDEYSRTRTGRIHLRRAQPLSCSAIRKLLEEPRNVSSIAESQLVDAPFGVVRTSQSNRWWKPRLSLLLPYFKNLIDLLRVSLHVHRTLDGTSGK
jgi:hypothetical protein